MWVELGLGVLCVCGWEGGKFDFVCGGCLLCGVRKVYEVVRWE